MNDGEKMKLAPHEQDRKPDVIPLLTPREKEILFWIAQGFSNAEISIATELSEKTVKNHVSSLLKKLGLRDRTQAAILAWRVGLAGNVAI